MAWAIGTRDNGRMSAPLVFGGSGLVGAQLLRQLHAEGVQADAITRNMAPPADLAGLARWHVGGAFDLHRGQGPWPDAATLLSTGPLAGLAGWLERVQPESLTRLVALGSTSERSKRSSPDPDERALAENLRLAEQRVIAWCERQAVAWTLLRPTLIWGEGRDRNISRVAALARSRKTLPLPAFATGRRQPIRSRDVAAALRAALRQPGSAGKVLDLPGGEVLRYDEMVQRIVTAVAPSTTLLRVPSWIARPGIRLARRCQWIEPAFEAMLMRMGEDLVYDDAPMRTFLALSPEGFEPRDEDFPKP